MLNSIYNYEKIGRKYIAIAFCSPCAATQFCVKFVAGTKPRPIDRT